MRKVLVLAVLAGSVLVMFLMFFDIRRINVQSSNMMLVSMVYLLVSFVMVMLEFFDVRKK